MQPDVNLAALFDANYTAGKKLKAANAQLTATRKLAVDQAASISRLKAQLAQDARGAKKLHHAHASLGLECEYRRRLQALIDKMHASTIYWVRAAYRATPPELHELKQEDRSEVLAQDAPLPANALKRVIRKLARRWNRDFKEASEELARWFARANRNRSLARLHQILRKGGWGIELQLSPAQRDILQSTVHENVALIRSIPQQYFTQVEGAVMRSVQAGRDLHTLTQHLQRNYRVTKKRAQLIARDQNNKVTSAFTRVNQLELGIEKATWRHSHAGKVPRPTHVAMDGQEYDVRRGMWDPAERAWVFPGQLINCRCFSVSKIPGFE